MRHHPYRDFDPTPPELRERARSLPYCVGALVLILASAAGGLMIHDWAARALAAAEPTTPPPAPDDDAAAAAGPWRAIDSPEDECPAITAAEPCVDQTADLLALDVPLRCPGGVVGVSVIEGEPIAWCSCPAAAAAPADAGRRHAH